MMVPLGVGLLGSSWFIDEDVVVDVLTVLLFSLSAVCFMCEKNCSYWCKCLLTIIRFTTVRYSAIRLA